MTLKCQAKYLTIVRIVITSKIFTSKMGIGTDTKKAGIGDQL